ncbi:16S rRNA (uracil(1498)-N(3))-methyltransferase [Brucella sp. MAB-22]|nr:MULTISPECIES: 16S rRNA (uracil(1498)-N(3))-methyltransferase [Brucella/Ochrobactrum group]MCQ9144980.1 16S rRNA (uracil(1498)-N(3))-methyltransferase [Ochrobactrum sp. BTU2]QQC28249.1 16S rRNA (uracil(1498)-N(3))-methyltransferase [Brucella anthropi]UGQ23115.1 16S rRNA (uracil(1498)-N(3))-methyltransferase [Brucella anthropi]UYT55117.1 16S rRNA (uracil(1498)-N(3))-methyltransferase [Brucella sp. MAB-22]
MQRLYVENDLDDGDQIEVAPQAAHYLTHVLRLKDGDEILAFNGRHGEWKSRLKPEGKKRLFLMPFEQTRPQPLASDLVYCFAPLKQGRLDYMVQKAVEMGAGILQPVITQHTQVPRLGADRIKANAIEAAEQCGVLSIPECCEAIRFDRFIEQWDKSRHLIFCDEGYESDDPLTILQKMAPGPVALLIGPEGGFSEDERQTLRNLPFVTAIPLGPRILRADTAAVAAMALVQSVLGDWRNAG